MRRPSLTGALALTALTLGAATAQAQEPGVTIDPASPTGRQYSVPVQTVRQQAAPSQHGGGGGLPGSQPAPLFGVGVRPVVHALPTTGGSPAGTGGRVTPTQRSHRRGGGSSAGGPFAGGRGGGPGGSPSSSSGTSPSGNAPAPTERIGRLASEIATPSGGSGEAGLLAGAAALVLVAGAAVGLVARRRRSG